jgi:predicted transcriptional regulator
MGKRRNKIDILNDMLSSIIAKGGEIKPTHLMYKSNLSHSNLKSYLEELVEKNLVKKIKKNNYDYVIMTDDGFSFAKKLKEMKEFEDTFGL